MHSKTRGMGAGRKLRSLRREERWADKDYNRSHLGRCAKGVLLRVNGGWGAGRRWRPAATESEFLALPASTCSEYKKPFAGASHAKGIVLEKM
jgi:small subunit ribosomal protein S23e